MNMLLFGEQLLNGVILGSMYALMGGGLALVYGTMRVMNFAHGELFMLGGYVLYVCISYFLLPPMVAVALALVLVSLFAGLTQVVLIKPILKKSDWELSTIVTTLGLSIALQAAILNTIGEEYYTLPYYIDGFITIGEFRVPLQRALILAVAVSAVIAMELFLKKSRTGWALRATAQDPQAASAVGIPAQRIFLIAFLLSGLLAALAAVLMSPINSVNPWAGVPVILKAFVVVIMGGMGSFRGTIIAGFLLGIIETLGVTLTSSEWREVFSFGLLILVLWFKPEGIFGGNLRRA